MEMVVPAATSDCFLTIGRRLWSGGGERETDLRRFCEFFGCSPLVCSLLWDALRNRGGLFVVGPQPTQPRHLLWSLLFLKQYSTEAICSCICGCDEKTFRTRVRSIIPMIAELDLIQWERRNIGYVGGLCRVVVDGTDFRIQEPQPFDAGYYSHKFKHAGLRYKVALSIATGFIVWVNGPFPCGAWSDLQIARSEGGIQEMMVRGERYIADSGYRDGGEYAFTPTGQNNEEQRRQTIIRARHETINGRFKRWRILSGLFRHGIELHYDIFMAIANITELEMEFEEPVFGL